MYDIIIIGSGPAGQAAALKARKHNLTVALIERSDIGGTCLNWGCIPTKALLRSAQQYQSCLSAKRMGVEIQGEIKPSLEAMVKRSRQVVDLLSRGVKLSLEKAGVELILGEGRILSQGKVQVNDSVLEAKDIIIATGSHSKVFPSIEVDHKRILTAKDALQLENIPQSITIIGSGAIGTEFAFLYASLGSKVTILEFLPQILPSLDGEIAQMADRALKKMRIKTVTGARVESSKCEEQKCVTRYIVNETEDVIESEYVLSATGIEAEYSSLGLENIGITIERGRISVDDGFETSCSHIYAIGDTIASMALAHVATLEGEKAIDSILGVEKKPTDYTLVPAAVFISPEIASVGYTEEQLKSKNIEYSALKWQYANCGKAAAMGERDGLVKILVSNDGKILGAHIIGAEASNLMAEVVLAKSQNLSVDKIAQSVHIHPSLSEIVQGACLQLKFR
ncbi:MAG: dihydrolipoyl dehydrogenase [Alistipes sp.]|nr:dihydrolipoyl dehydrogenase [Candidatus Alistipes equi]